MSAHLPPRGLEWLLRAFLGEGPGSLTIVGDLREEYAAARRQWPRMGVLVWYAGQVLVVGSRIAAERMIHGWGDGEMIGSIIQDIRYGVRSLLGAPLFTLVAVVTLAIGVGATTSIYSVVHGVLLAPLPFAEPDRLVEIGTNTGGVGWYSSSPAQFIDYEEQLETLASVGGYVRGLRTVGDSLQPRRVDVAFLTQGTWETLGVQPILGRVFDEPEDQPGASTVVVLSEGFWRQEFGGDPNVMGQTLMTNGTAAEVVGVMPDGFAFPDAGTAMWIPFQLNRDTPTRGNHFVNVVGRLSEGRSIEEANAEISALAVRSVEMYPQSYSERGFRARVISLRDAVVGDLEVAILIAFGAVLMVLLIAAVNVANLVLSRGELRRGEITIRAALGAGRARITRQLLTESLLLAGVGGVLGIGIARIGVQALVAAAPDGAPRFENVAVSGPVLVFALLLVAATAIGFGLWPAIRATSGNLRGNLATGDRNSVGRGGQALRRALVVSQVALAAVLALSAGVMIRSLDNLYSEDLGFSGDGVMTFRTDLPGAKYQTPEDRIAFYQALTEALASEPGIRQASVSARLPLFNTYSQLSIHVDGRPVTELGAAHDAYVQVSSESYFDVMRIRPTQGRLYTGRDGPDTPLVTVINETMARQLFAGEPALGQRIRMWSEGFPYMEVVGVIPDVKEKQIADEPVPRMYMPYSQTKRAAYSTPGGLYVSVLTETGDPASALPIARRLLSDLDPTVPISRVKSMDLITAESLATERFARSLLQIFGIVAILLACVGVYGVLSVSVSQRVPEIGLRKALGASSEEVIRGVVGESALLASVGGGLGIVMGVFATRAMGSLMYGVHGSDPVTLIAVVGVIALTAVVAAALPALRASRVDPMVALKGG